MKRATAFTLIELLVVISIIAVIVSVMLPALGSGRRSARDAMCLANLRSHAEMTTIYLGNHRDQFPMRISGSDPGGGSVYGAFLPTRLIVIYENRPLSIFACPEDSESARVYPAGTLDGANPEGLGVGDLYGIPPEQSVRYSYGINNMTGIPPSNQQEQQIFNPNLSAYPSPTRTLLYADCTWVNARGHKLMVNDSPVLKGRVANSAAPIRINATSNIPPEYGLPHSKFRRHRGGSNIIFMDSHAEIVAQDRCFSRVLYSWTER